MDYWRKPILFGNVGAGRISPLADMDTIGLTVTHHHLGSLGCSSPDFVKKTQLQRLLLLRQIVSSGLGKNLIGYV